MRKRKKETEAEREARFNMMCEVYGDLPDGAFYAAMEEQGFTMDDIIAYAKEVPNAY
jgi:hypothetical protein